MAFCARCAQKAIRDLQIRVEWGRLLGQIQMEHSKTFGALRSVHTAYVSKLLLCSCWVNTENFANFGPGINLFELVFEFFTKAIEQTIVFSYFFHELFRINFTFHLAKAHTRVKSDRQLVVMVSCRLKCCTLGNHSIMGHIPIA